MNSEVPAPAYQDDVLFVACKRGDCHVVEELVRCGLTEDVTNYRDQSGSTALMVAAVSGHEYIVSLLLQVPCVDVNTGDNEGNTPLMFAAEAGHYSTLETLLLFPGVGIDNQNQNGFTALIKAAVQGRLDCIHLLLGAGASCTIKDYGRSFCAYEWARFCGRKHCAKTIMDISRKMKKSDNGKKSPLAVWSSEPDLSGTRSKRHSFAKLGALVVNLFKFRDKRLIADFDKSPLAHAARCVSTPLLPTVYTNPTSPVFQRHRKVSKSLTLPEIKVTSYVSRSDSMRRSSSKRRSRYRDGLTSK